MDALLVIARLVLAGTFIVSGVAKLADLPGSRQAVVNYGVPQRFANAAGLGLPILELLLALMLLPVATATLGAFGLLVLLIAFIIGIAFNLARGNTPDCHCFGQLTKRPIGHATIIQDVALAAIALFITASGLAGNPGPSLVAWAEDLAVLQWVLLALVIVQALVLAGVVWLLVHLLGQNGRLLVRLDKIEAALADADIELADDEDEEDEEEDEDEGLPIGVPAPAFSLTGLYGETATLDSLRARGNPVLLVFTDPGCGPCNALMPDIGKWQRDFGGKLTVALISRGAVDANKGKSSEHGLANVLLQNDNETADAYRTFGTPTGVLVSADGLIASGAAPGGDAIRKLATQAAEGKVPAPKRIERKDAPVRPSPRPAAKAAPGAANIGKPAPTVELPDLDGNTVRLADSKGSPTAVLFWNPGCGFCQRMADDVKAWEADPPAGAPKLLVVSTGDAERNRAHGFRSPIVLDDGFNAGRSFGASGTPSAVLIGADGNVASAVAVGAPGVLGLLRNELPAVDPTPSPSPAPSARQNGNGAASVGKPAPTFELQDLDLNQVKLADFAGHPTAVLFWNPGCGFCQRMADDIKAWEADPPAGAPKLLVVSTGDAERNRAQGFASPVVLDANFTVGRSFGASGTPSAVLIDADGSIKSPVAVGAPGVLGLLRNEAPTAATADDDDDDEPETPSIGSPAPVVRLPDINGNMVDLADHRGTRTLLVFWNPGCGFCRRMVDDLKAWEANPPTGAPKLMLVSTGSVEDNKAQGLRSPILLDASFDVGRSFGSTGTPSAVLVDARGNVASELAVGAPGVMELARSTKDATATA